MIDFSPLMFKDKEKEIIQRKAYDIWVVADYKGTLEIATGVGKTMIGLMAMQQNPEAKTYIVVPKIDLQQQWIDAILEFGLFPVSDIGRVGDGHQEFDKRIVVAVVNSVRDKCLNADLLIMDEMHRYGSIENFQFVSNGMFKKIMGLTATAFRQDGMHDRLLQHAPMLYQFGQIDAIQQNILSEYDLYNIGVPMTEDENDEYQRVDSFIKNNFKMFNNDFMEVKSSIGTGGTRSLVASDLMRMFSKRRTIVLHAKNKIKVACDIINRERKKSLVFCEYIKTADQIKKELNSIGIKASIYHSKMSPFDKREMLEGFKSGSRQVMVAVKSLDEGTNIPDCEMAIIVGGSSVERQMIQRLGRILRKCEGKNVAKVFQLYIPHTKDFDWMNSRLDLMNSSARNVKWMNYKDMS